MKYLDQDMKRLSTIYFKYLTKSYHPRTHSMENAKIRTSSAVKQAITNQHISNAPQYTSHKNVKLA